MAASGYAWHYLDVVSDDGEWALVVIAFVGNPFSTRYAAERRRRPAPAEGHVALNVALHGPRGRSAWCLTEQRRDALLRDDRALRIGRSSLTIDRAGDLQVHIDERTAPLPGRVVGDVLVSLEGDAGPQVLLDDEGRHRWRPIAPATRAEVRLEVPGVSFAGSAYLDAQDGDEPLEDAFRAWTWSRTRRSEDVAVCFDVERRDGTQLSLGRAFSRHAVRELPPVPRAPLSPTRWRLARSCRSEDGPRIVRPLEDGPCYARALVESTVGGERGVGIHETLDLDRLRSRWVRFLLPFRTRRAR